MGGNDGLRADSVYMSGNYLYNDYLGNLSNFYTRTLNYCPGNVWAARIATQALEMSTFNLSYPYGQYFNFTGTPRYIVASAAEMPYSVALGLQGYRTTPTVADMKASAEAFTVNHLLGTRSKNVAADIALAKSIGAWKDHEALEDHPDLKQEAKELEARAKALEKKLELTLKNEAGLAPSEILENIQELAEEVKDLNVDAKDLFERCKEAEAEYNAKKAEEEQERIEREAEEEDDVSDESSVATKEGDKEMDTDELAEEYDVKKPIIDSEQDVSSIVTEMKRNTNNSDDAKNYKDFMAMFTTGKVNSKNIVEVLDGVLSTNYNLYNGIYEMDNSSEALGKVFETLRARVNELKSNGYLTAEEAKNIKDTLVEVENQLGTGEDIPSTSPKVGGKNVNEILKDIVAKLKGKGTQSDFDAKIEAKQDERIKKATADFYKDHANANPGKEVNGTPALPAGVTYLPNSKMFQWEYDSSTVFKAKSYKELREKIWATKKEAIMTKWMEVTKELDKGLKDKAAS